MTYEAFIEENHEEFAREYENDRNDAAWDDATVCAELETTLNSEPTEEEIDEMADYFVAYVATSPEDHMTRETMPLPEECRPTGETQVYTEYGFFHMRTDDLEKRAQQAFDDWARDHGYTMEQTRTYTREYVRRSIEIAMDPDAWHRSADTEAKRVARRAA